jgi:hypothetical protein
MYLWKDLPSNEVDDVSRGHKTITSVFKTGLDGWSVGDMLSATSTAPDPNNPPTFNPTGGFKNGYISTGDTENIVAFLAPAQYTGNLTGYYGGSLSFEAQDTDGADPVNTSVVVIYGDGMSMTFGGAPVGTTWTAYNVPLTQKGWTVYPGDQQVGTTPVTKAQFKAILADVTNIAILADWLTGGDNSGLDSVVLAAKADSPSVMPSTDRFVAAAASLGATTGHAVIASADPRHAASPLMIFHSA